VRRDILILGVDPENRDEIYRRRAMDELHHRLAGWPKTFDYVLMLDFGKPDNPLPDLLIDVARGSFFSLYAVAGEHPRAAERTEAEAAAG
jgi:hypothetical protein